jgi:hypothetical protein
MSKWGLRYIKFFFFMLFFQISAFFWAAFMEVLNM